MNTHAAAAFSNRSFPLDHPTDSGLMTLAYTKMEDASLLSVFNKMRKMRHVRPAGNRLAPSHTTQLFSSLPQMALIFQDVNPLFTPPTVSLGRALCGARGRRKRHCL